MIKLRRVPQRAVAAALVAGAAALPACGDRPSPVEVDPFPPAPDDTLPYVYVVPEQVGDGWTTASLSEVGLSEERLTLLVDLIRSGTYGGVHGLVIVREGKLVFEEYFSGIDFQYAAGDSIVGRWTHFDRQIAHNLASVTKSITSTLVGITIAQGLIDSLGTPAYDFFPDYSELRDARKDSISLHHLLTMASGLEWDEQTYSYGDHRNDINALFSQADPLHYILAKPALYTPGSVWRYSGGNTILLGDIVRRASGLSLEKFADEYLFGPLGITDRAWLTLEGSVTYASGDLRLRPRDMAKIGQLFLAGGVWNGDRLFDPAWVRDATTRYLETRDPGWGYGYQWWLHDFSVDGVVYPTFGARGWGGQMITVLPEQKMIVVLTGGNYLTSDPADAVIRHFVLEALLE